MQRGRASPWGTLSARRVAEYLQVSHHTLYQVSAATALVEGIYQGAVRVGTLREHGDLGLGTFENLDGEMVVVDGQFFQVRSDGCVRECDDDVLSPFAVVTRFARRGGGHAGSVPGFEPSDRPVRWSAAFRQRLLRSPGGWAF